MRTPDNLTENDLSLLLKGFRDQHLEILDLTVSNPTIVDLPPFKPDVPTLFSTEADQKYAPDPRGYLPAREAIAATWSKGRGGLRTDRMWVTSGTSEAYSLLIKALAEPGDRVLVPSPSYPLLEHLLLAEGAQPSNYLLNLEDRWRIDFESLEREADERTKGLVVVHPNNPTGSFVHPEDMRRLKAFCRERSMAILSDEVFFEFPIAPAETPKSFVDDSDEVLTFTLGGFSKLLGLPQFKASWIYASGPDNEIQKISGKLDWLSDLYLSGSPPLQHRIPSILVEGLRRTELIRNRVLTNYRHLLEMTRGRNELRALPVEGGWAAILELLEETDEEEVCLRLLRERRVSVQPGYYFDLPLPSSVVVSLLPSPALFERGLSSVLESLTV